jgi:hypothetical protein
LTRPIAARLRAAEASGRLKSPIVLEPVLVQFDASAVVIESKKQRRAECDIEPIPLEGSPPLSSCAFVDGSPETH